ncbi:TfoX/Sxy family DNA transformation protein [Pseudocitrobacter cyperus]|uniref:TfoX/Sxy family DNA transformation protein n=1 Tax=Pseudocitrobacter cyperus TaxID=3112843 RepID=A0ABV0HFU9_9ENTR
MKKISYKRIYQSQECLSPLGVIRARPLFGGYSLTVDDAIFAMVAEGELYLRACEDTVPYQVQHNAKLLTLQKRSGPHQLNYFKVDARLWRDQKTLLKLSSLSLQDAKREKNRRHNLNRLRDLPNISFQMELLLRDAGVKSVNDLRRMGAKTVWLKLRQLRENLSTSVILSLEGALTGVHAAALPLDRRQELIDWASALNNPPAAVD